MNCLMSARYNLLLLSTNSECSHMQVRIRAPFFNAAYSPGMCSNSAPWLWSGGPYIYIYIFVSIIYVLFARKRRRMNSCMKPRNAYYTNCLYAVVPVGICCSYI